MLAAAAARAEGLGRPSVTIPCGGALSLQGIYFRIKVIKLMPIIIHTLSASSELKPYAKKLLTMTKSAISAVSALLPLKDIDVVFYVNPEGAIKEIGGIGGYTPTSHVVFISLNPHHPKFKYALTHELLASLAHEFHHAIRFRKPGYGNTLREAMISEGLADHFAMEITGRKESWPWSRTLSHAQKKLFLKRASREWRKQGHYDHTKWFFGSSSPDIPRWTGYTLGYDLVETYLRAHPGTTASELVSAPASLFI